MSKAAPRRIEGAAPEVVRVEPVTLAEAARPVAAMENIAPPSAGFTAESWESWERRLERETRRYRSW